MNIGSLYTVKKYYWLLFPTRETACDVNEVTAKAGTDLVVADNWIEYLSKFYQTNITYLSPESVIVFLEEDGKLKKVLTSDGKIGWTFFIETYNVYFEEINGEYKFDRS